MKKQNKLENLEKKLDKFDWRDWIPLYGMLNLPGRSDDALTEIYGRRLNISSPSFYGILNMGYQALCMGAVVLGAIAVYMKIFNKN